MNQKGFSTALIVLIIGAIAVGGYFVVRKNGEAPGIESPSINNETKTETTLKETNNPNPKITTAPDQTLIEISKSPLGGNKLLSDDKCLNSNTTDTYKWGIAKASRDFLINKGYSSSYFDEHFCPIQITYDKEGYARVVYKATFTPYLAWWQHHFPVFLDGSGYPKLIKDEAQIDTSGKKFVIHDITIRKIQTLLSPQKLQTLMQNLIGPFDNKIKISIGIEIGEKDLGLYARASNLNPNSTSCVDTDRIGTIDVETGKGVVTFNGGCR